MSRVGFTPPERFASKNWVSSSIWKLEHEEIDSISGLVLTLLGRPPEVGDEVEFEGLVFRVVEVEGRGVSECIVWRQEG